MRSCTGCGTRLRGPKFHGFVRSHGGLVCGRSQQKRTVVDRDGKRGLVLAKTPECSW